MSVPDVSLVVPARDEAGNVGPLVAEIRSVLDAAGLTWEAFLIDDGSADDTWDEISAAAAADPRVQGI
ncbi:MAG: glycosyltransferase, partial [Planctomycetaceae bacterium]